MTAARPVERLREAPVRFTADEFMELVRHPPIAEWVGKIELVEGEIVHMAPTNIPHWRIQHDVAWKLRAVFLDVGPESGWLVGVEPTVRFAPRGVRLPDIGVFRDPNLQLSIFAVADLFLAVDVADTSFKPDLGPKRHTYARAGVPHYWIVDVNGRRVFLCEAPRGDGYAQERIVPFGEPIPVPGTGATIVID